jgi:hypothetical protein
MSLLADLMPFTGKLCGPGWSLVTFPALGPRFARVRRNVPPEFIGTQVPQSVHVSDLAIH